MKHAQHTPGPPAWKHVRDILLLPFTVAGVVPWLIHRGAWPWIPAAWPVRAIGAAALCAGVALFIVTVRQFVRQGRGTLAPWTPTQQLIVSGPYRHCRNPMISGVLFVLIGQALLLRSLPIAVEAVLFFAINTLYFVLKEEPDLRARFGPAYTDYQQRVPRWIPRWR